MKVMEGNVNAKCGERIMDFYMMIRTSSGQAARYVAANLPGPDVRSLRCHCAHADLLQTGRQQTIINKSTQQMINDICHRVRAHFTKEQKIAFSLSIDATANASMLLVDKTQMVLVGGTPPHHSIPIPEEYRGERLSEFLDKEMKEFEKIDTGRTLATKVKLATISFQKNGQESPLLQLAARPQTKNEASNFNYKVVDACLQAEGDLRGDGWDISFTSSANNGVRYDEKIVQTLSCNFVDGVVSYCGLTDPNHNVKNGRYQMVVGRNSVKTIGQAIIDTGFFPLAEIEQELWRVKDFALDLIVLKLASTKTVFAILSLLPADPVSNKATCITLFFMRMHLFAVNNNVIVTAKTRVFLLWSSLIFMLGVHHTTKKNGLLRLLGYVF